MSEQPVESAITVLLQEIGAGHKSAYDRLMPLVYDELKMLADAKLRGEDSGHTLQATALVNEAYMKIAGLEELKWRDRKHFFGAAAETIRRILVDHARRKKAQKRGGGVKPAPLDTIQLASKKIDHVELLALDEALNELAELDERQSRIVVLKHFGGMKTAEIAEVLDVSLRTVEGDWTMARSFLRDKLGGES